MSVDEFQSFEDRLSRYGAALSKLERLGVRITPDSRLRKYERELQRIGMDTRESVEQHIVTSLIYCLRETDEIAEIIEYLPDRLDDATKALLRQLNGGTTIPDDEVGSKSREAQYELYLGTVVRSAGLPVTHGKPDLTVEFGGLFHFVEAKRPSHAGRVEDLLRKGVSQLADRGSPGVVAISLDQVIRPTHSILEVQSFADLAPETERIVSEYVQKNLQMFRKRCNTEHVRALLLTARIPARILATGHTSLGTNVRLERLVPPKDAVVIFAEALTNMYMAAIARVNSRGHRQHFSPATWVTLSVILE